MILLDTLVLACACGAIAGYSYYQFLQCDYMQYGWSSGTPDWTTSAGYTTLDFIYLVLGTYFFPLAIVFLVAFCQQSFNSLPHESVVKVPLFYTILGLLVAAAIAAFYMASGVLSCIGYFCINIPSIDDPYNTDDGSTIKSGQDFVGMVYFFTAWYFGVIFLIYLIMLHREITNSSPGSRFGNKNRDRLEEEAISRAMSSAAAQAAAAAAASSRAPRVGRFFNNNNKPALTPLRSAWEVDEEHEDFDPLLFDQQLAEQHLRLQQEVDLVNGIAPVPVARTGIEGGRGLYSTTTSKALTLFAVFGLFYPLVFFACCVLPTWWNNFTVYGIHKNQATSPQKAYGMYWSITISSSLVFKLFPDILIYYGAIYAVAIVSICAQVS